VPKGKLPNGELENRVLDALWSSTEPMTPGEVHQILAADRALAYTTVMTILVRLWDKGLLARERRARAYAYRTILSREERAAARMQDLLTTAGDGALALGRFVEALDPDQRDELRRALRATKRGPS
jgi:predicted transcriptional regulator